MVAFDGLRVTIFQLLPIDFVSNGIKGCCEQNLSVATKLCMLVTTPTWSNENTNMGQGDHFSKL
jgi:hypothetical protein